MTPTAQVFESRGQHQAGIAPTVTTAALASYSTDMMFGGLIKRDCNGANRTDVTTNAANLVAALGGCVIGTCFEFTVQNVSAGAFSVTISANVGVTLVGTMVIQQSFSKRFRVEVLETAPGLEAYRLDSLNAAGAF